MGRRSASNDRYRKGAGVGSTRRSSASLKPKRDAGSAPSPAAKKSAKTEPVADPPEIKRWRIIWFACLGVALVPVAYMFVPGLLIDGWQPDPSLARIGLAIEFGAFAAALYIDFAVIRKLRKQAAEAPKGKRERKPETKDDVT